MIFTISKAEKVSWIYKEIKDFCRKANAGYGETELSQWIRSNISNPMLQVIVSKKEKDSGQIDGFALYYLQSELMSPKLFVQAFYAVTPEAKEEMVKKIIEWGRELNVKEVEYVTSHDPKWMIERFNMIESSKGFEIVGHVLRKKLED